MKATVAAPSATEENADAANTALDVAANINSAAPSAAAEDADASASTAEVAASARGTVVDNADTTDAAPEAAAE
eukprot:1283676-Pleurochrysis_carterae.AAC.1